VQVGAARVEGRDRVSRGFSNDLMRFCELHLGRRQALLPHVEPSELVSVAWIKMQRALDHGAVIERPLQYAKRVVRAHCVDLHRRLGASMMDFTEDIDLYHAPVDDGALGPEEVDERVRSWREGVRLALDRAQWPTPRGVRYPSVMLLALRVAMLQAAAKGRDDEDRAVALVTYALEWRPAEAGSTLHRESGVELSRIWGGLVERHRYESSALSSEGLCAIVNELEVGGGELRPAQYRKWIERCKRVGRDCIGAEPWNRYFAHLLPGGAVPLGRGRSGAPAARLGRLE